MAVALAGVLVGPSFATLAFGSTPRRELPDYSPVAALVARHTNQEDIIVSDVPWVVGWYADRRAVGFPVGVNGLAGIESRGRSTSGILLTSQIAGIDGNGGEWAEIVATKPERFGEFELVETLDNSQISAVMYQRSN